jgi:hypothetical protein
MIVYELIQKVYIIFVHIFPLPFLHSTFLFVILITPSDIFSFNSHCTSSLCFCLFIICLFLSFSCMCSVCFCLFIISLFLSFSMYLFCLLPSLYHLSVSAILMYVCVLYSSVSLSFVCKYTIICVSLSSVYFRHCSVCLHLCPIPLLLSSFNVSFLPASVSLITINVPLFKKLRDIIFFVGQ